jgi:hypothetical protein
MQQPLMAYYRCPKAYLDFCVAAPWQRVERLSALRSGGDLLWAHLWLHVPDGQGAAL